MALPQLTKEVIRTQVEVFFRDFERLGDNQVAGHELLRERVVQLQERDPVLLAGYMTFLEQLFGVEDGKFGELQTVDEQSAFKGAVLGAAFLYSALCAQSDVDDLAD